MGNGRRSVGREFSIFPQWCALSDAKRVLLPMPRDEEWCLQTPKPPATWPWDIKRALATLSAAGGGSLNLTVKNVAREARLMRLINDLHGELISASYSLPDDRSVLAGQLNCKAMLEDPALLGFEVSVSALEECETVCNLVSMALFGTLAGERRFDGLDVDLRLLAGSHQVPNWPAAGLADTEISSFRLPQLLVRSR